MRFLLLGVTAFVTACVHAPSPEVQAAPGVSTAWVTFDANGMTGAGSSGFADRARMRPLNIHDPVRIASVSKLVVALGVMRLKEEGRIDLDADVSEALGWSLRNPAYPDRPITLRMLLSHTSGLRDDADYVIPLGRTVRETAAHPKAFDLKHAPGSYFHYSNLNFPVVASVLERVTGERFDRLMERLVLKPLALDACFNWTTCSDAAVARAVVLYDEAGKPVRDDLGGKRPDCPVVAAADGSCDLSTYALGTNGALFSPQGGLRISASDLAKVGQLLLRRGRISDGQFLSEASLREMMGPLWRHHGSNGTTDDGFYCAYGLAVQSLPVSGCRDDLFGGGRKMFGHAGEAYGLRSGLWVDPEKGVGIAFFATGNGDNPPKNRTAYTEVEERLAAELRR